MEGDEERLKAVVKTQKGSGNIELWDMDEPKPGPDQVAIEVAGAGICGSDLHIYHDDINIAIKPPVIIGHEFSGVVAEVGKNVQGIKPGNKVVSETTASYCGKCIYCQAGELNMCLERRVMGYWVNGSFAKYCAVPSERVHLLPENVDLDSAALTEPLACCVHGITELSGVSAGDTVVVVGPGTIGLLSMEVAKAEGGKTIVLGTAKDRERLELARSLGADLTLEVESSDPAEVVRELTDGYGADVVVECSGAAAGADMGLDLVRKKGKYLQIGLFGRSIQLDFEKVAFKEIKLTGSFSHKTTSWKRSIALMNQGKVNTKALITDELPLSDWKRGFDMMEEKKGLKIIMRPV